MITIIRLSYIFLKPHKALKCLIAFFILLSFLPGNLNAADTLSYKGKEFYLTFMPNFHNEYYSSYRYVDSLHIFIASDYATSGTIEYKNRRGNEFSVNFTISNPDEIYHFKTPSYDFELRGFNMHRVIEDDIEDEYTDMSFHITADDDIVVYAHNQAKTTSEAFLVFPVNTLDKEYYVMSYNSDGSSNAYSVGENSTPSEFAVVATEDDTELEIQPSCRTWNTGSIQTITRTIHKGEVFLVQALIANGENDNDLTGTLVMADKPVAVFSGHQRAAIPHDNHYAAASRDCLIEQMIPISTWGRNAIITTFQQPLEMISTGDDLYRIMAAYDSTEVFFNNNLIAVLDGGKFIERELVQSGEITATKPILVAQYKKTSQSSSTHNNNGDPFMMVIPPKEQFLKSYKVINIQGYEYDNMYWNLEPVYNYNFISVIIPDSAKHTLTIDGVNQSTNSFSSINGTDYVLGIFRVSNGKHFLNADAGFGVLVYGYGYANSYGYIGGMNMEIINDPPPEISAVDSCYSIIGIVNNTLSAKKNIREVVSLNEDNTVVNIATFSPPVNEVNFMASLTDYRQDGAFSIKAYNMDNAMSEEDYEIPGFTIGLDGLELVNQLPEENFENPVNREYCFDVTIHNYGKFSHNIDNILLNLNDVFTIVNPPPSILSPGQKETFSICFFAEEAGNYIDTLSIYDGCHYRDLLVMNVTAETDTVPPAISSLDGPCMQERSFTITESGEYDYGIQSFDMIYTQNCYMADFSQPNAFTTSFRIVVDDPYYDAIYSFSVIDSLNNEVLLTDTIQGLTISFPDFEDSTRLVDFAGNTIGIMNCDSIEFFNYGLKTFVIDNLHAYENIYFSLPVSQLPIVIPPNESRKVCACFRPLEVRSELYSDTIGFEFNCIEQKITLLGEGESAVYDGESRCKQEFLIVTTKAADDYFLDIMYPNPVTGIKGTVRLGIPESSNIKLTLYDIHGNTVKQWVDENFEKGLYQFELDFDGVTQGQYFYVMDAGARRFSNVVTVVR